MDTMGIVEKKHGESVGFGFCSLKVSLNKWNLSTTEKYLEDHPT